MEVSRLRVELWSIVARIITKVIIILSGIAEWKWFCLIERDEL